MEQIIANLLVADNLVIQKVGGILIQFQLFFLCIRNEWKRRVRRTKRQEHVLDERRGYVISRRFGHESCLLALINN